MHYFIACKSDGWFTLHTCHILMPAGIVFLHWSWAKMGLAILSKKNLLTNFQQLFLIIKCHSIWTVRTSIKHYHFLYFLCTNKKVLLQVCLCSTFLTSAPHALLSMTSGVSFLEGWSQTQNQNLHWRTEIELQNWSSCYMSREHWHWNNLSSNSRRNKNGIFTFTYRKEIARLKIHNFWCLSPHSSGKKKIFFWFIHPSTWKPSKWLLLLSLL